jgi:hypothetical protein
VRADRVVVATPALDHDLRLLERIEHLAVEQLVPELTCVTPIERIASATGRPCAVSTSTCRSLATISSGLCLFLDIDPSSFGSREPYLWEDLDLGDGDGTLRRIHHVLSVAVRDKAGREASPTTAILDSQSARGAVKDPMRRRTARLGRVEGPSITVAVCVGL